MVFFRGSVDLESIPDWFPLKCRPRLQLIVKQTGIRKDRRGGRGGVMKEHRVRRIKAAVAQETFTLIKRGNRLKV